MTLPKVPQLLPFVAHIAFGLLGIFLLKQLLNWEVTVFLLSCVVLFMFRAELAVFIANVKDLQAGPLSVKLRNSFDLPPVAQQAMVEQNAPDLDAAFADAEQYRHLAQSWFFAYLYEAITPPAVALMIRLSERAEPMPYKEFSDLCNRFLAEFYHRARAHGLDMSYITADNIFRFLLSHGLVEQQNLAYAITQDGRDYLARVEEYKTSSKLDWLLQPVASSPTLESTH